MLLFSMDTLQAIPYLCPLMWSQAVNVILNGEVQESHSGLALCPYHDTIRTWKIGRVLINLIRELHTCSKKRKGTINSYDVSKYRVYFLLVTTTLKKWWKMLLVKTLLICAFIKAPLECWWTTATCPNEAEPWSEPAVLSFPQGSSTPASQVSVVFSFFYTVMRNRH